MLCGEGRMIEIEQSDERRRVWVTFSFVMAGTLAAGLAQIGLAYLFGYTIEDLQSGVPSYTGTQTLLLLANTQVLTYLLPGLLAARVLFNSNWPQRTGLAPAPRVGKVLIALGIFVATLVLTAALAQMNQSLEISDWMAEAESNVTKILTAIIMDTSWSVFGLVLFVIAILPAVGEELVFRGLIQPGFIAMTGSVHFGVWLTAIMFGLIHVQFAGLLPRIFLGAVLGFLAVASGRLWIPILAHALYNGAQVVAARLGALEITPTEAPVASMETIYLMLGGGVLAGAALHFGLPYLAHDSHYAPPPPVVEQAEADENDSY